MAGLSFAKHKRSPVKGVGYVDPACPIEWAHPLNRGLVFDTTVLPNSGWSGGATLRDIVKGGKSSHDGTLTATSWVGGVGGKRALHYNGTSSYVSLPIAPANFQLASLFSIAFWTRGSTNGSKLFGTYNNYPTNSGWVVELGVNTVGGIGFDFINSNASFQIRGSSNISVIDGNWHHCVITYIGNSLYSGMSFYVDGRQGGTFSTGGGGGGSISTINNVSFWLGRWTFGYQAIGDLGGIQFYNYVMSASKIAQLYQEQRRGRPETLRWIKKPSAWSFISAGASFSGEEEGLTYSRRLIW